MKKILLPLLLLFTLFAASCSEDFDTAAPYKNITVVYGMLDIRDTAHYIRIQKAFLDQNKSAVVMALEPDSLYYPNLDVKMKVLYNNAVINTIPLTRVDLNMEGYPKDSGQFSHAVNYAYKFKNALSQYYTYRLVIYNPATGETDSSVTPVISNAPDTFRIPFFQNSSSMIDIAATGVSNTFNKASGAAPPNAIMFEGILRFHWIDVDNASGNQTNRYADWKFATTDIAAGTGNFQLKVSNKEIYSGIRNTIGVPETGHSIILGKTDIFVWTASQELFNYKVITETQSNSLTADEIKPNYTNIKGKNVLGLFASRTMVQDLAVPFTSLSIDSLKNNEITKPLNIIN